MVTFVACGVIALVIVGVIVAIVLDERRFWRKMVEWKREEWPEDEGAMHTAYEPSPGPPVDTQDRLQATVNAWDESLIAQECQPNPLFEQVRAKQPPPEWMALTHAADLVGLDRHKMRRIALADPGSGIHTEYTKRLGNRCYVRRLWVLHTWSV